MEQQAVSRHITKRVALDKGVLTYRTLSRELGLSVAEAKTHLGLYVKEPSTVERGVKVTWALSGWLLPVDYPAGEDDGMEVDPSQGDSQPLSQSQGEDLAREAKKRGVVLCTDDRLEAESARFSPAPSKHVYALSPSSPTLAALAASSSLAHPSTSNAAGDDLSSWKPAPADCYGTITHPDGPRKRTSPLKPAKAAPKPTTVPNPAAQKAAATTNKADVKGKGKEPAKSAAGGMASLFAKPTKPAQAARPIGQLGGLFAPREPPPPKEKELKKGKEKEKVIPSKRKAEEKEKPKEKPKPVKKASNGIFDDEMDDDDDFNEEDEAALLEMEAESQGKAKGGSSKPELAKHKSALEAELFSDDEDKMVVDPPAKKAAAPAKVEKKPVKKQGTLSFLKK